MSVGSQSVDAADAAPDFAEVHNQLLTDRSIQFDLPPATILPTGQPQYAPPPGSGAAPLPIADAAAAGAGPAIQILLWGMLAVLVLVVLYWVAKSVMDRRRAPVPERPDSGWRPEAAPALMLLGEADALAAGGRYGEAARLILHRSIEDIQARRPSAVRPALTSRDIAALPALPGPPRAAFARIAMLVERSLFAQAPLAAADWRDCRAAYEEFAFAESWAG